VCEVAPKGVSKKYLDPPPAYATRRIHGGLHGALDVTTARPQAARALGRRTPADTRRPPPRAARVDCQTPRRTLRKSSRRTRTPMRTRTSTGGSATAKTGGSGTAKTGGPPSCRASRRRSARRRRRSATTPRPIESGKRARRRPARAMRFVLHPYLNVYIYLYKSLKLC
jgi:hypothetical protein